MGLQTHVAKIPSSNSVILAAGYSDGVDLGDEFMIIQPGLEIMDESTNLPLGNYDRTKEIVEVVEIFEQFCIAKHIVRSSILQSTLSNNTFMSSHPKDLSVSEDDIKPIEEEEFDKNIHIGDIAVKIN